MADFRGQRLVGRDFTGQNLRGANFEGANLFRANLSGADLSRAILSGAILFGANLTEANLTGVILFGANLAEANLSEANLVDIQAIDADLSRANLTGADLTGANLTGADLTRANLTEAVLTEANLTGADLTDADLTDALLINTQGLQDEDEHHEEHDVQIMGGPAFEIHDQNRKFLQIRDSYIRAIKKNIRETDVQRGLTTRGIKQILERIIQSSSESYDEKRATISRLNEYIDPIERERPADDEAIGCTLAYVLTLPQNIQDLYVNTLLDECLNAYGPGSRSRSCAPGFFERMISVLNTALIALKSENEDACDETCNEIINLFSRQWTYNDVLKNWRDNIGRSGLSEQILAKFIELDEGRIDSYGFTEEEINRLYDNFRTYALNDYRALAQTNDVPPEITRELDDKRDEFKVMMRDSLFGGRKKRKTQKGRKTRKGVKKYQKSKKGRISGRMKKVKTKRNIRNTKKKSRK